MLIFKRIIRRVIDSYRRGRLFVRDYEKGLNLTVLYQTEKNNYGFHVIYNGYDYEVKVYCDVNLVSYTTGFATKEEAESYIEFYKRQV